MAVNAKQFPAVPSPKRSVSPIRVPKREEIPLPEQPKRRAVSLMSADTGKQPALNPPQNEQQNTQTMSVNTQPDAKSMAVDTPTSTEPLTVSTDTPTEEEQTTQIGSRVETLEQLGEPNTDTEQMQALLEAWKNVAEEQQKATIDRAVQQAVTELENVWQNTQGQFQEQAESIALQERQAMDNAALYAELRGDRGGIGQEQYSSIQNTAAHNRFAVQQAQTQLSADIARQIEDLRVQGEFEKADAVLQITQDYLEQLLALEQWATEFQFSQEEFAAQLEKWLSEYELTLYRMGLLPEQMQDEG